MSQHNASASSFHQNYMLLHDKLPCDGFMRPSDPARRRCGFIFSNMRHSVVQLVFEGGPQGYRVRLLKLPTLSAFECRKKSLFLKSWVWKWFPSHVTFGQKAGANWAVKWSDLFVTNVFRRHNNWSFKEFSCLLLAANWKNQQNPRSIVQNAWPGLRGPFIRTSFVWDA